MYIEQIKPLRENGEICSETKVNENKLRVMAEPPTTHNPIIRRMKT